MINIPFRDLRIGVGRYDVSEKEFVDDLDVRPGWIEVRFFLVRIVGFGPCVRRRGETAEYIGCDHFDELFLSRFGKPVRTGDDEVDELDESLSLRFFFSREFEGFVGEGEDEGADLEFFYEEGLTVGDGDFTEKREVFELGVDGGRGRRGVDRNGRSRCVVYCDGGSGEK